MNGTKIENPRIQRRKLRSIMASERREKSNFYFFELGFIFGIIPLLVVSFVIGPVLYYFTIEREFYLWPFIVVGILVAFFQIIALQYFIKRFYLDPQNMTLGEFLRYKFDARFRAANLSSEKGQNNLSWYEELDDFIMRIRAAQQEKTERIYATAYQNIEDL